MIVKDLIALLQNCDPNAEVYLASQPNWPFEYAVMGVTSRDRIHRVEHDEDDAPLTCPTGCRPSDVLLVEGQQLRYGNRAAWDAARTH